MYNFIDNYIFLFKEYCNYILTINTISITPNTFLGVLVFGWLTSLNPCSIAILPIYFSYTSNQTNISRSTSSFLFISGFITNFMAIGIFILYFARIYKNLFSSSDLTSGILLLFVGMNLLKVLKMSTIFDNNVKKSNFRFNFYLSNFMMGFSSGLITSACNIPILIALLAWLGSLHNSWQSFLLAATYLTGYSLSIMFASILANFLDEIAFFNKVVSWTTSILGSIIVSSGIFSICRFFKL